MKHLSAEFKRIFIFIVIIAVLSVAYYIYALFFYPPFEEQETFLSEIGEELGELGLWLLVFVYMRTFMKLLFGKGAISKRLFPDYTSSINHIKSIDKIISYLDRTHIYFGISAIAIIILHIMLMGIPMHILFFPALLILIIWQGLFGLFISWRYSPKELKKISYLVHAQLFTGITIGIFAYLGHALID